MAPKEINLPAINLVVPNRGVQVGICYARSNEIWFLPVEIAAGSTIAEILSNPAICTQFPVLMQEDYKVGIFGKLKTPDTVLQEQDRLEIYRPLIFDPMEARRRRAGKRKSRKM